MKLKAKIISSVTALAIAGSSSIMIPHADAQESSAPEATNTASSTSSPVTTDTSATNTSSTQTTSVSSTNGNTTIAEFPSPVFTPNTSESSVVVKGTKDWSSSLELAPEGTASVTANIKINGDVKDGSKVGIYDGNKLIEEAEVSNGSVKVSVSDLPKDVHTFQIKSDDIDLAGMKCSADKGIDIPTSKDKTLEAIKDYETAYEAAKKKYQADLAKFNAGGAAGGASTVVTTLPDTTTVVTSTPTGSGSTQLPGGNTTPTTIEDIEIVEGTPSFEMSPILKGILGALPIAGLIGIVAPQLSQIDINNITKQFPDINSLLQNDVFSKIMGGIQEGNKNINDIIQSGLDGLGIKLPNIDLSFLDQYREQLDGMINTALQAAGPIGEQAKAFLDSIGGVEALLPILGGILAAAIIIPAIVTSIKPGEDSTVTNTNTVNPDNPGSQGGDTGNQVPVTSTQVIPGSVVTTTVPNGTPNTPPTPNAPTPPTFIEEELGQRDLPVKPVTGGFEFDIEAGSVIDCEVDGETTTPVNDDDKTDTSKDKATTGNSNNTNNSRANTCDDIYGMGFVNGVPSNDPLYDPALDADSNGIACDTPIANPVYSGQGGPAVPVIEAVPAKVGPAVNTGGDAEKVSLIDTIKGIFSK